MLSTFAAIGFDPEIRGILVVAAGAIVLFGSIWMILATNSGVRLASLIALAGFFGWMVIMGAFWWIRGIGYVGDSVSWQVLDYNRGDLSQSSVERAHELPEGVEIAGKGFELAQANAADVEELQEFVLVPDRNSEDFADLTDEEFADAAMRQQLRNESTTLSQLQSVAPDFVDELLENGDIPNLGSWEIMTQGEAGEAQATAGAAILEQGAFEFEAQTDFRFLEAFRTGGKPRLDRDVDLTCTFCGDNLERGWHWIANSARIKNPTEYAVVQLQAVEALPTAEGQAPPFPTLDEDQPVVSVVLVRELGNLRFPPAMITLGSLLIFVALSYMLHLRDLSSTRRVEQFEAE